MEFTDQARKEAITERIERDFSEKRRVHTYAVRDLAVRMAKQYGADPKKAETAALFHDLFRGTPKEELNDWVRRLGLPARYLDNPNLAHGKIAAAVMRTQYGIADEDVLNAVSYHTTGRAGMSLLEKIIYLADAIEPNRSYPGVEHLRDTAASDLDRAVLDSLSGTIDFIRGQGLFLDEDTVKAREDLLRKEKKV